MFMIQDETVAREISELMLDIGARVDRSVERVKNSWPEEDFARYRAATAAIMAEILVGVLNPLYEEHPHIKPADLD